MNIIKLKDYNHIYAIDSFLDEYVALFGKNKSAYLKHLKKLRTNLKILDSKMEKSIQFQQFEKLEGQPFYSIRHVSKINPRVIFVLIDNDENVILLSSCKEKSKGDYDRAIAKAQQRMHEMEVEE